MKHSAPIASTTRPVALIILDGWGVTDDYNGNAITRANPLFFDYLLKNYPSTLLDASSHSVGLPWGEMGNSEVGHFTIGAGRIVKQSLYRIDHDIVTNRFFENTALLKTTMHVKKHSSKLHIMGLIGNGGVHASQEHLYALLKLIKREKVKPVYLHLFLDGRDSPKDAGLVFLKELKKKIQWMRHVHIASFGGRMYGMDRNQNWKRIEKAYNTIVEGESDISTENPEKRLQEFYDKKIYDEQVDPVVVTKGGEAVTTIDDNDGIIFFNFRPDRARQMTRAMINEDFDRFPRKRYVNNLSFTSFTKYADDLDTFVAFEREMVHNYLTEVLSNNNLTHLHAAETEKYAHVTYFFNGLSEKAQEGEDRILVPSPVVESYDLLPQMSAGEVTEKIVDKFAKNKYNFTLINYANPDMVGHTGNMEATVQAIKAVDTHLKTVTEMITKSGGVVLVTADHGNAEELIKRLSGDIDKEHSTYPVPFILVDDAYKGKVDPVDFMNLYASQTTGVLADIAPTVLGYFNLPLGDGMTGIDLREVI
ncbi:2,3-bisphosphoglycerate-independent phosphoglycerate mutase [Patescibacteria group bacterium]|nr:2,3-bisphosphoglycerate-independent phosphoglycerate mutase [Patescibacteria group bacterium]